MDGKGEHQGVHIAVNVLMMLYGECTSSTTKLMKLACHTMAFPMVVFVIRKGSVIVPNIGILSHLIPYMAFVTGWMRERGAPTLISMSLKITMALALVSI